MRSPNENPNESQPRRGRPPKKLGIPNLALNLVSTTKCIGIATDKPSFMNKDKSTNTAM